MTTVQIANMTFDAWSVLFSIILTMGAVASRQFEPRQARALVGLLVANAVVSAAEVLAYLYRGDVSDLGYGMVRISNFTVFLSNHILLLAAMLFVFRAIESRGGSVGKRLHHALMGVVGLGIVLLVLSRVFGFYYGFDDQNRYYRMDSYWIMLALEWSVIFVLFLLTVKNWKLLAPLERVSFVTFELLPLVAIVIQNFTYGVSLTAFANTAAITMVFVTYEIECSKAIVNRERSMLDEVIVALAKAVDAKDPYTNGHSVRVAKYSRMLAQRLGLPDHEVERIHRMAVLHDVGKIGVPDEILKKPGKLTPEEYKQIQGHTVNGDRILRGITSMPRLHEGARWHHERVDGLGYPDKLSGGDIPLEARIIGVADSYDAMTSDRVYRKHLPQEVVREELVHNMGTQFDPDVARAMLEIMDEDPDYELHG